MLDGLMRGTVLAKTDGVVGHHMDDAQPHQRRKTDRRPAVVGEGEKGAAIGDESAMQREAIHRGGHAVLANSVVDVAAGERTTRHRSLRFGMREVRMRQVRRAADQSGNCPGNAVEHLLRGLPRRQLRTLAGKALAQFRRGLGIGGRQGNGLALDEKVALPGCRAFVAVKPGETRVLGVFAAVECATGGLVLRIESERRVLRLSARSFDEVEFISYRKNGPNGVACGEQPGVDGNAVAIEVVEDDYLPQ